MVASTSAIRCSYGFAPQVVRIPLVSKRSFTPNGMPCSGPRYLPALISRSALAACASASSSVSVTTQCRRSPYRFSLPRYIFVRSVEVIRLLSISDASTVTGWNARSSSEPAVTCTAGALATAIFAPRDDLPVGCLPGMYGRNVIAGSVSSGTASLRSSS